MRIGIDIDDTIAETSKFLFPLMLREDTKKGNLGILNNDRHIFEPYGRFYWSSEEIDKFLIRYFEKCSKMFETVKDSDKVIARLIEEGHEIYLITARPNEYFKNREKSTIKWLKAHNIKYDKLIFSEHRDKTQEIRDNNIDLMIDDSVSACIKMINSGVSCLLKITSNNFKREELSLFKCKAESWEDIYQLISVIDSKTTEHSIN